MNGPIRSDPWQWWRDKLAGKPVVNDGTLHPGFYRKPHKQFYGARKTYTPVAYWPGTVNEYGIDLPVVFCRDGDQDVNETRALELWAIVHNHPVTEEAYRAVAQDGKPWPDEHELVDMRGHNRPPEDIDWDAIAEQGYIDPTDLSLLKALEDEIDNLSRDASKRLEGPPIADQDEADRLANQADALAQFQKIVEGTRARERKPHDEQLKAIQKKWAPWLLKAETYKNIKFKLLTPWLQALKKKVEEAAQAAAAAGEPAAADARRPRVGTRGRAMTLKTQKSAEITDYKLCLEFFADSPDVRGTVQMLANRAVRAGATPPGTKVIEDTKAV